MSIFFIKNKANLQASDYPPGRNPESYPPNIYGIKLTENQVRKIQLYGGVSIQRNGEIYQISSRMIRREIKHKIRTYV